MRDYIVMLNVSTFVVSQVDRLLLTLFREITKLQETICERSISNANGQSLGTRVYVKILKVL